MGKLLFLAGLARNIYSKWLFQRLLTGILVMAALTLILVGLSGAAIAVGFYAIYIALLHHGFEQEIALALLCALIVAVCMILFTVILRSAHKMRQMPRSVMHTKIPVASKVGETINAFFEGLLADS